MATALASRPPSLRLPTRVPVLRHPQLSEPPPPREPMNRPRYAVIPTKGNRHQILARCVNAIAPQIFGYTHIVHNSSDDWVMVDTCHPISSMRVSPDEPMNLSKMWNRGLDAIARETERIGAKEWDVAILNDDAIVPEGWFDAVSANMRATQSAAGCSGPVAGVLRDPGPVPLHTRMVGPAFIVAGELGLRGNEDLKWWYTDDWMDWESRKLGGMAMVPGFPIEHLHPNGQMSPELQVQAAKDGETFRAIYGQAPW